jgi:hypothetical protein
MSPRRELLVPWLFAGLVALVVAIGPQAVELLLGVRVPAPLVPPLAILFVLTVGATALLVFQALRFVVRRPADRRPRLAFFETVYNGQAGWYVERAGQRVALLLDSRFVDMFWYSYRVEPLAQGPEERHRIQLDPGWWHQRGLVFRSRELGVVAEGAFAGGQVFTDTGRVIMRGLYCGITPPDYWERGVLWVRKRFGGRRSEEGTAADRPRD